MNNDFLLKNKNEVDNMAKTMLKIPCPYCKKSITLDKVLTHSIEEKMRKDFESKLKNNDEKYHLEVKKYKSQLEKKDKETDKLKHSLDKRIEEATKIERKKVEKEAGKKAAEAVEIDIKDMKEQLKEKDERLENTQKEELKLRKEKRELEKDKDDFKLEMERKIDDERKNISEEAAKKAVEEYKVDLEDLTEQIKEKDERLEKTEKEELKLRKEKRELEKDKDDFKLEMERKMDDERKKISEEATQKVVEEHKLKDKENKKQLDDLNTQIADLKRKAEQGSQQLQGEILELQIEDNLREAFRHDIVEPISTGVKGADILQKVCLRSGQNCGTILIESKNTKKWSKSWIQKLKKDQREAKSDIGVIVTKTLPDGVDKFNCIDGIMIVDYRYIIPVTILLRNQLIEIARVKSFNIGRNEKMDVLYTYLTGTEFKQRVEATVESFSQMMTDLQKEKRAMTKIWSKREKQLEQAFYGIAGMYGDMQGIIGSSLPEIKSLSLIEHQSNKDDNTDGTS